jgi:hypothetical protein
MGCFFQPNIEQYGYTACTTDADCAPGRHCNSDLCTPPPWYDLAYQSRRLLVVENSSDDPLEAGSAIPVRIGEGGLFTIDQLGPDGRFLHFDQSQFNPDDPSTAWSHVATYRDLYSDFLVAWIRLEDDLEARTERALSWVYHQNEEETGSFVDAPQEVFSFYDNFTTLSATESLDGGVFEPDASVLDAGESGTGMALDPTLYLLQGDGEPNLSDGQVTVLSGQKLALLKPLVQPFRVTLHARLNGLSCAGVFIGVMGDTSPGDRLPYLGFRVGSGVALEAELAPSATSNPGHYPLDRPVEAPTALHRYSFEIDSGKIRLGVDEEEVYARNDLTPPFSEDNLYLTVDSYGDCSIDLEEIMVTSSRHERPLVRAESAIALDESAAEENDAP